MSSLQKELKELIIRGDEINFRLDDLKKTNFIALPVLKKFIIDNSDFDEHLFDEIIWAIEALEKQERE